MVLNTFNAGLEANVVAYLKAVAYVFEICVEFVAKAKIFLPVEWSEGIGIQVVRSVDAGSWITVFPPDAANS